MMAIASRTEVTLNNCRILVVEDEYMIAQEIVEVLSSVRADALGASLF